MIGEALPAPSASPVDTSTRPAIRRRQRRILISATFAMALTGPGQTAGLSVFTDPLIEALQVTRAQISTAYLIGTLSGALLLPLVGRALDRYGPRAVTAVIGAGFGGLLLGMSAVTDLLGLAAGYVGVRLAGQGALTLIATTAVGLWFDRRRGTAMGIVTALGAVGISLTPVLTEWLIGLSGWRAAWAIQGIAVWALLLPIALAGLRGTPPTRTRTGIHHQGSRSPLRQAMRTPIFWIITAAVAAAGLLVTAVAFHQISLLGQYGLAPAEAAANFVPQTIAGLAASAAVGPLCDRLVSRPLIAACMLLLAAGLAFIPLVGPGWRALLYALLIGSAASAIRTLEGAVIPRYFGTAQLGAIRGFIHAISVGSTAFGPIALALAHHPTQGYTPALLTSAAIPALIAVAALITPLPSPRPGS